MKNIVEQSIAAPPSSYEAYLYRFTNLLDGKMYVGIHKGSVDDSYNHSSTNEDFAKIFSNPKSQLKFEVLEYGDYITMQNAEHKILKKDNARKNPMYYNKSNGFPQFAEPDIEHCKLINQQIDDGVFPVLKEDLQIHAQMSCLQVRYQHDPELQRIIKEKIDDAHGITDACNPVLVWEGRGLNGEDLRGDGNHTVLGASQSKHAVDIPVMRIPYSVHCDLTDEELRFIGNLRNKNPEIIKKPISKQDGVKYVLDMAIKKVPYNAQSNLMALKEYGFTRAQIQSILQEANQTLETRAAYISAGRIFIKYDAQPHKKILEDRVRSYHRPDLGQCAIFASSGSVRLEHVLKKLYQHKKTCTKCVVVIHHPTVASAKEWKTKNQPDALNICGHFNIDVEFVEMDMWIEDISIQENKAA